MRQSIGIVLGVLAGLLLSQQVLVAQYTPPVAELHTPTNTQPFNTYPRNQGSVGFTGAITEWGKVNGDPIPYWHHDVRAAYFRPSGPQHGSAEPAFIQSNGAFSGVKLRPDPCWEVGNWMVLAQVRVRENGMSPWSPWYDVGWGVFTITDDGPCGDGGGGPGSDIE